MSKYEGAEAIKKARTYKGRFKAFLKALRKCPIPRTTGVDIQGDYDNPIAVCAIGYAMILLDIPENHNDPWRVVADYFGLTGPAKIFRINDGYMGNVPWNTVVDGLKEYTLPCVSDKPLTTS